MQPAMRMAMELQIGRRGDELPCSIGEAIVLRLRRIMHRFPFEFLELVDCLRSKKDGGGRDSAFRDALQAERIINNDVLSNARYKQMIDGLKPLAREVIEKCVTGERNNLLICDWIVEQ